MKHWIEGYVIRSGEFTGQNVMLWPDKLYDTWDKAHDALIKKVEDLLDEVKKLKPF